MKTPPRSVLIIVTRRIGDVLLATPAVRSLKQAWPGAALDMLVFEGTQGVIAANPDVRRILTIPERPRFLAHLLFVLRLLRRYDVALSLLPGDRPTLYAFLAGRWRAGLLHPIRKEAWKRRLLHHWVPFDAMNTHAILAYLALTESLRIASNREVVVSWSDQDAQQLDAALAGQAGWPIAVLHPYPKFNYKMWHREGWVEVARWLDASGFRVALTGSADPDEKAYVAGLAREMPLGTLDLSGRLSLGATGCLLSRSAVFLGPDTALAHIAAAVGIPTVAFFGPTDPLMWGPWPQGYSLPNPPWSRIGSQSVGRVRLLQGNAPCVPCNKEGCERHVESFSDCLQEIPASRIIAALESVIGKR